MPAQFVLLRRTTEVLELDPLNPHLLFMATSTEGNSMARQVTSAMTQFVHQTVHRAIRRGQVRQLDSVATWAARDHYKAVRGKAAA